MLDIVYNSALELSDLIRLRYIVEFAIATVLNNVLPDPCIRLIAILAIC
jgi:hypothetical protein